MRLGSFSCGETSSYNPRFFRSGDSVCFVRLGLLRLPGTGKSLLYRGVSISFPDDFGKLSLTGDPESLSSFAARAFPDVLETLFLTGEPESLSSLPFAGGTHFLTDLE